MDEEDSAPFAPPDSSVSAQPALPPVLGVSPMVPAESTRSDKDTAPKGSFSLISLLLPLLAVAAAYYGAGPIGKAGCVVRVIYEGGKCPLDCWKESAPLVENESSYAPEMSEGGMLRLEELRAQMRERQVEQEGVQPNSASGT